MNNKEKYKLDILKLDNQYNTILEVIRKKYVEDNSKFNIGDYIYNVTGIIKIEKIDYDICLGDIDVVYIGYRYKKSNGVLSRTKDNKLSKLKNNLKRIDIYE